MGRHLKILEFALTSLFRRTGKNFAIIVVYAFTVGVIASILLVTGSLKEESSRLLAAAPELVVQRLMAGRHDLIPARHADAIGGIPGVSAVAPRYWGYYYDSLIKANYTVQGKGDNAAETLTLLHGRLPAAEGECAVGSGVSESRLVGLGEDLILVDGGGLGRAFEVVGIFQAESRLLTNDLIVLTDEEAAAFFRMPEGLATDLAVSIGNEREIDTVAAKIQKLLPDTRPITRREILRTYDAVFNWRSGMMLTMFLSALVTFAILAWDKATGLSAEERREIGILKAVGWDTADVIVLKFWEGVVISVTAFLLGMTGAVIHVYYLDGWILARVMKGWSVLFPEFHLVPRVDLYRISVIGFLTILPYVASTVIPSWKSAITDPDSVMRG